MTKRIAIIGCDIEAYTLLDAVARLGDSVAEIVTCEQLCVGKIQSRNRQLEYYTMGIQLKDLCDTVEIEQPRIWGNEQWGKRDGFKTMRRTARAGRKRLR